MDSGERVLLRISGKAVILESLHDPIQLALQGKKFASITPDQVEAISLEQQGKGNENPINLINPA
jgi:hypothetical protein